MEEGVCELPGKEIDVETPCGVFKGIEYPKNICAVSIMRSGSSLWLLFIFLGDSLLQAFTDLYPDAPIGKVLIQRDESSPTKEARVEVIGVFDLVLLQQASEGYFEHVRFHLRSDACNGRQHLLQIP